MLEQLNLAENQIRNEGVQARDSENVDLGRPLPKWSQRQESQLLFCGKALAGGIEKNGSLRKLNLQENNIGLIGSQAQTGLHHNYCASEHCSVCI